MSVITLEFPKCCSCGARATKKLELVEFETGIPAEPKHYCEAHFPAPLTDTELRLLVDRRDAEIARLRAALEACEQAVRDCPSLDENGYICQKSDAIKAIREALEQKE